MKNFDDAPFLVIWELTQACDLACVHCRACAVEDRNPMELTTGRVSGHDGFRRVEGSFSRTLQALEHAQRIGLQTQINTTVTRHNMHRLAEIAAIVERFGAKLWSVFFLVATGRASISQDLTAEEYEQVFEFLYETSKNCQLRYQNYRGATLPAVCSAAAQDRGRKRRHAARAGRIHSAAGRHQ